MKNTLMLVDFIVETKNGFKNNTEIINKFDDLLRYMNASNLKINTCLYFGKISIEGCGIKEESFHDLKSFNAGYAKIINPILDMSKEITENKVGNEQALGHIFVISSILYYMISKYMNANDLNVKTKSLVTENDNIEIEKEDEING